MEFLSLEVRNHIGIVTMNRPPVNALITLMYKEIDDNIWTAVFKGEGKSFSTGNDVREFITLDADSAPAYARNVSDCAASVYECRGPVICAVHGLALGAGLALASCGDIIIASEDAAFGLFVFYRDRQGIHEYSN